MQFQVFQQTNPIPDIVAGRLGETALNYVQNRALRILAALEAADAVAKEKRDAGFLKWKADTARLSVAREAGFVSLYDLMTESVRLRTACYIVIDMFSGIRDSEMMWIGENCIARGKSKDHSTDVLWLHGTIYKTGIRPKKWLVPPAVEEAVKALTLLTEPLRQKLQLEERELETSIGISIGKERLRLLKRLNTVRKQKDKLFLSKKDSSIFVLSGTAMRMHLKRFCADFGIRGEDGQPYPLHSHQFRRTYARFMARAELGDFYRHYATILVIGAST